MLALSTQPSIGPIKIIVDQLKRFAVLIFSLSSLHLWWQK